MLALSGANYALSVALFQVNEFRSAVDRLIISDRFDTANVKILYALGNAYRCAGMLPEAVNPLNGSSCWRLTSHPRISTLGMPTKRCGSIDSRERRLRCPFNWIRTTWPHSTRRVVCRGEGGVHARRLRPGVVYWSWIRITRKRGRAR